MPLNTTIQPYRRTTGLPHHLPKARRHLPNTIGLQPSPYILNADKKAAMTLLGKWFWKQFNKVLRMRACLVAQRKEKERRLCKRYRYGLGKDVLCFVFCTIQWRMQRHTTSHLETKREEVFQWESSGWEAEACTPPGLDIFRGFAQCLVSSVWFLLRIWLHVGSILSWVLWRVDQPGHWVTPRLWSGSLCGCYKWCLLLLVEWRGGFCGALVCKALATYVVLVPFLLVK